MLQVQLAVPSLKADATVTAALKRAEDLTLEIQNIINIPETSSLQKVIVRYGTSLCYVSQCYLGTSEFCKIYYNFEYFEYVSEFEQLLESNCI